MASWKVRSLGRTNRLGEAVRGLGTGQGAETVARNQRKRQKQRLKRERDTREQECTDTHRTNLAQRNIGADGQGDGEKLRGNTEVYPSDLKSLLKNLGTRRTEKKI